MSTEAKKPRRVILDVCLDKATANRWRGSAGQTRHKHVRVHKRMARAEGVWATAWVVVGDEARSDG